jgi:predicted nucleic acid-binding protein
MGRYFRAVEMARKTLVLDASVGVKWFSTENELALNQALEIRDAHISNEITVVVPDLFYYEVANSIVHKKFFSDAMVLSVTSALFDLGFHAIPVNSEILSLSAELSRKFNITIYDSCYMAIARNMRCPLVTANPRHQKKVPGFEIIPLEEWKNVA